jgi:hypothetical protein
MLVHIRHYPSCSFNRNAVLIALHTACVVKLADGIKDGTGRGNRIDTPASFIKELHAPFPIERLSIVYSQLQLDVR